MLRLTPPDTPVTVNVYVPFGVPPLGFGGVLPPPPQAEKNAKAITASAGARTRRERRLGNFTPAIIDSIAIPNNAALVRFIGVLAGLSRRTPAIDGAVVVTVTVKGVVEPLTGRLDGETVQTARLGAPLQLRDTVPVKPLAGVSCRL
jgi:hypothetical protein